MQYNKSIILSFQFPIPKYDPWEKEINVFPYICGRETARVCVWLATLVTEGMTDITLA